MTRKNSNAPRPKAVDLFCGAGGMSLGFERAGFDIVLSVDSDPCHVATHARNFPYAPAWARSVADLTGAEIRDVAGEVDVLFGGPPCQGFSHMGLRNVDDPRNSLVGEFVRIAAELRPRAVVMENVPGLGTGRTKPVLDMAIQSLEAAGYLVTRPVQTLNAADFGAPQHRERLFLLAVRSDVSSCPIPYPLPGRTRTTVREALEDLPTIPSAEEGSPDRRPYDKAPASLYSRIARGEIRDPADLSHPRVWDRTSCSGCTPVKHSPDVIQLYAATEPGTMVPGHRLPRLHDDRLSPTLRAGSSSDHGSYTAPRPVHPVDPRCITSREAARLHGFPDWFEFYPSKWHAYRQIGNAVCPVVAHAVGREIRGAIRSDAGRQPTEPLELPDLQPAAQRPKHHARLREVDEFPKVLARLFQRSGGNETSPPRRPRFGVREIAESIVETEAQLPRIEPGNFLSAVARSRNVKRILAELRSCGWTVRADGAGGGEFVPIGTPGALEERDKLAVSSSELLSAIRLPFDSDCRLSALELPDVWKALREAGWSGLAELGLERNLLGEVEARPAVAVARVGRRKLGGIVVVAEGSNLPRPSQVRASLDATGAEFALVLGRMTSRHLLVVLLMPEGTSAAEKARLALRLESRNPVAAGTGA